MPAAIFPTRTITEALTLLRGAAEGYDGLYEAMRGGDAEGYGQYAAETMMDTLDNVSIAIPNSDVTASAINNYSREPLRRVDRVFTASYDCATEDVKAAIFDAIAKDERILSDPAPFVRLLEYKGSHIEYVVRVWCKNADYRDVYFDLNENVRESFKEKGVAMTYEHVNVHVVEK